uniref:Uncharacterized protein n=1 Tax=Lepeophtheirus salmonis TaxID=72036 RepID=A0A0K2U763_LEPSM
MSISSLSIEESISFDSFKKWLMEEDI